MTRQAIIPGNKTGEFMPRDPGEVWSAQYENGICLGWSDPIPSEKE